MGFVYRGPLVSVVAATRRSPTETYLSMRDSGSVGMQKLGKMKDPGQKPFLPETQV